MGQTSFAYLRPEKQEMKLLPHGDVHKFRYGDNVEYKELSKGYHEIEYNIFTPDNRNGRKYQIYYLNNAVPTTPKDANMIAAIVEDITGHAGKILSRFDLDNENPEDILERLQDRSWLEEIHGIGPSSSERLQQEFQCLSSGELEVFAAFNQHGIPYRQGTMREKWAEAFFSNHEDELQQFISNPYYLTRIDEESNPHVWQLDEARSDLNPTAYPLDWVDDHVDETWMDTPERARAFFNQSVKNISNEGHTVSTPAQLAEQMKRMGLSRVSLEGDGTVPVDHNVIEQLTKQAPNIESISYLTPEGYSRTGITTTKFLKQADSIHSTFRTLSKMDTPFSKLGQQRLINNALEAASVQLDDTQKLAVQYAFGSPVSIITGPAGSGKSTVVQSVLASASELLTESEEASGGQVRTRTAYNLYAVAPTGKAAQRIKNGLEVHDPETGEEVPVQSTDSRFVSAGPHMHSGQLQVGTLHSFLGWKGSYCELPPPHPSFIIVDESSMCDQQIMYWLGRYIDSCIHHSIPVILVLTGDIEQLEPVGAGHPYRDLIGEMGDVAVPTTRLNTIHRQGQGSAIIDASSRLLEGSLPPDAKTVVEDNQLENDFYWHARQEQNIEPLQHLRGVAQRANYYRDTDVSAEEVRLIIPLRNPSSVNDDALFVWGVNSTLQETFAEARDVELQRFEACNPERPDETYTTEFASGDRVTHVGENRYVSSVSEHPPVSRGSIGHIVQADPSTGIVVSYPWMDENVPYYLPEEIHALSLAYALTGHTAQGSEFKVTSVVLPSRGAAPLMSRPWLYTAITRGQKFVDLTATSSRVLQCAQNNSVVDRQTILSAKRF